jgi:NAD(P)-dependent dehydrogenase (short-subunit alcohol dehydrogenase family)
LSAGIGYGGLCFPKDVAAFLAISAQLGIPFPLLKEVERINTTGGAGFLGSHLADRLLAEGFRVIAIDNTITGSPDNITHLASNPYFEFICQDVSKFICVPGSVEFVFHLASPASPVDYLELPIPTLKVGALGTPMSTYEARTSAPSRSSMLGLDALTLGEIDHLAFTAGDALVVGPFDQVDLSKAKRYCELRYWGSYYAVKHAHKRIRKGFRYEQIRSHGELVETMAWRLVASRLPKIRVK